MPNRRISKELEQFIIIWTIPRMVTYHISITDSTKISDLVEFGEANEHTAYAHL